MPPNALLTDSGPPVTPELAGAFEGPPLEAPCWPFLLRRTLISRPSESNLTMPEQSSSNPVNSASSR